MIAENKTTEETEEVIPLTMEGILKCFYLLLCHLKDQKMTVQKTVLDNNVPKDFMGKIRIDYFTGVKAYQVSIIQKRKRGVIVTPSKRIITPN